MGGRYLKSDEVGFQKAILARVISRDGFASHECRKFIGYGIAMNKKDCYGILDRVFPKGDHGIRQVPPECFDCADRVTCLREAINTKEGLEMKAQLLVRAEQGGLISRFQRWSQKKHLSRRIKQGKKP